MSDAFFDSICKLVEKNDTIRIVKSSNKFSVLNQNSSKKLYNINNWKCVS